MSTATLLATLAMAEGCAQKFYSRVQGPHVLSVIDTRSNLDRYPRITGFYFDLDIDFTGRGDKTASALYFEYVKWNEGGNQQVGLRLKIKHGTEERYLPREASNLTDFTIMGDSQGKDIFLYRFPRGKEQQIRMIHLVDGHLEDQECPADLYRAAVAQARSFVLRDGKLMLKSK